jgi:hypothetical protein
VGGMLRSDSHSISLLFDRNVIIIFDPSVVGSSIIDVEHEQNRWRPMYDLQIIIFES